VLLTTSPQAYLSGLTRLSLYLVTPSHLHHSAQILQADNSAVLGTKEAPTIAGAHPYLLRAGLHQLGVRWGRTAAPLPPRCVSGCAPDACGREQCGLGSAACSLQRRLPARKAAGGQGLWQRLRSRPTSSPSRGWVVDRARHVGGTGLRLGMSRLEPGRRLRYAEKSVHEARSMSAQ
jgi:hypothetical protein